MNFDSILSHGRYYFKRVLQEVELRTGTPLSMPSEVWLKLTERCNCRCQMCDIWKNNIHAEGELSTQDWKNVLLGFRKWLGKKHIWFTGGEPFLRKDCIELISYGSSLGLSIGVITNGILLDSSRISQLMESGLKEFHVSIDSMRAEIHDHLRGITGAHERATQNVLALKDRLEKTRGKIKIVIKTIMMGLNRKEIIPLVEWVDKNEFDEIKFQPLESNLEAGDDPFWFNTSPFWPKGGEIEELAKTIEELIERKQAGTRIYNSTFELNQIKDYFQNPVRYYEQAKDHRLSSNKKGLKCKNGLGWMEILSRGGLRMCRYMPPQGDIRMGTVRNFWRNRPKCWRYPENSCFKNRGINPTTYDGRS
jgi:MoaA/NifB/PqqE/SkfB family radical SAM enzyme